MGTAILGVVLDSSVVIEAKRRRLDVVRFLKHIAVRLVSAKPPSARLATSRIEPDRDLSGRNDFDSMATAGPGGPARPGDPPHD
jgi:hypothetical protein